MKRVVGRFADEDDAADAEATLRDAGFEPERPAVENPFFDPSSAPPEKRGLVWGALLGGVLGAVFALALGLDLVWVPRLSPLVTAGRLSLVFAGFGVGAAVGGFVGGVAGTAREIPEPDGPRVAVDVGDDRAGEARDRLRDAGATAIGDAVTYRRGPRVVREE